MGLCLDMFGDKNEYQIACDIGFKGSEELMSLHK